MDIIRLLLAMVAICIVGFNPGLVRGVYNIAVSPIKQWHENPNDVRGASPLLRHAPGFGKDKNPKNVADDRYMTRDADEPKGAPVRPTVDYVAPSGKLDIESEGKLGIESGAESENKEPAGSTYFGAGAVAVQRARGL